MDTPRLPAPDATTLGIFRTWKKRFSGYAMVSRLYEDCTLEARQTIVTGAIDDNWHGMIDSGALGICDQDDIPIIMDKIGDYLRQHRNPLLDRMEFAKRQQRCNEKVDEYHAALCVLDENASYEINENCNHCKNLKEQRMRDKIVTGLLDPATQAAVLEVPFEELSLQKTLKICRAKEASCTTQTGMKGSNVMKIGGGDQDRGRGKQKSEYEANRDRSKSEDNSGRCQWCGKKSTHSKENCPANGKTCHKCSKIGHFSHVCKSVKKDKVTSVFCGNVSEKGQSRCVLKTIAVDMWNSNGRYKGRFCNVLPDTGAAVNLMGLKQSLRLGKVKVHRSADVLTAANGLPIST